MPQRDKSRHWLGELFPKVAVRVGRTPEERLAWLLEFAERRSDVRGQTVDSEELLAEIAAFAIAEGWHTRLDARPSLSRSDVEQLILDVRGGLRNLTADPPRPWEFRTAGRNLTWSVQRDPVGRAIVFQSGDLADVFIWQAHRLVTLALEALGACRRCSRLFVIRRRGQVYCSNTCSQAVRNARFQAARGGIGRANHK
ncbi:MAG: hypothetical protein WCA22_06850 [Candidatus Binatus sp.]